MLRRFSARVRSTRSFDVSVSCGRADCVRSLRRANRRTLIRPAGRDGAGRDRTGGQPAGRAPKAPAANQCFGSAADKARQGEKSAASAAPSAPNTDAGPSAPNPGAGSATALSGIPATPLNGVATSASRLGLAGASRRRPASISDGTNNAGAGIPHHAPTPPKGAVGVLSVDAAGAPANFSMRGFSFGRGQHAL